MKEIVLERMGESIGRERKMEREERDRKRNGERERGDKEEKRGWRIVFVYRILKSDDVKRICAFIFTKADFVRSLSISVTYRSI